MRPLRPFLILAALTACGPASAPPPTAGSTPHLTVWTTFYPLTYFTQRIAGASVDVVCPVPGGADPALWMPDDATIRQLQGADLVITNGASYESWRARVSLRESRLVDTSLPFADDLITYPQSITHSHGPSGRHSHEGIDGHTWMDPELAKRQAGEILEALSRQRPDEAPAMRRRYAALGEDLDRLAAGLRDITDLLADQALVASHPAYGYIARRYRWKVVLFALDPGGEPSAQRLAELRETARQRGASIVLWESAPSARLEQRVQAESGLASVVFSTCESLDDESRRQGLDYLTRMQRNLDQLRRALAAMSPATDH